MAIDMDGDGIETVGISITAPILFDHNADGLKTATGWLKGDDAWLVRDLNNNGTIDTGLELFGVDTDITVNGVTRKATSGFEALSALDSNGDQVFNASDAAFTQVKLWQDLNQDGISQANELSTLADKGITAISLTPTTTNTALGTTGNIVTGKATVTRTTGTTEIDAVSVDYDNAVNNLNLASNPFYSDFTDSIDLSADSLALPEMNGSGAVRDLRSAMSLDSPQAATLAATVALFAQGSTRDAQMALIDELVQEWGATSTMATSSPFAPGVTDYSTPVLNPGDATALKVQTFAQQHPDLYRKVIALEQFNGATGLRQLMTRWGANVPAAVVTLLESAYSSLRDSVYGALAMQTRLKPYLDAVSLRVDDQGIRFDTSGLDSLLETRKAADAKNGIVDLLELHKFASDTLAAVGYNEQQKVSTWLGAIDAASPLNDVDWSSLNSLSSNNDIYLGGRGNDSISAQGGNDFVWGGLGDDKIEGGLGDDTIDGGDGNDTITDASGANTLNGGAGNDTINGCGTFWGGEGDDSITASNFYSGDTYLFNVGDGKDTINDYGGAVVQGYATAGDDTLIFGAGIAASDVAVSRSGNDMVFKVGASDQVTVQNWFSNPVFQYIEQIQFADGTKWSVDTLRAMMISASGTANADSITGWDGKDSIDGGAGNDTLNGGSGNDSLLGGLGDDKIEGGVGDDTIDGGDGNDTITDASGANTLNGGAGNDTINGCGTFWGGEGDDSITASNFYSGDTYLFNVGDGKDTINDYGGAVVQATPQRAMTR